MPDLNWGKMWPIYLLRIKSGKLPLGKFQHIHESFEHSVPHTFLKIFSLRPKKVNERSGPPVDFLRPVKFKIIPKNLFPFRLHYPQ